MHVTRYPACRAVVLVCLAVAAMGVTCQDYDCCGGAPITAWEAALTGANHVPPVMTDAAGTGTFRLISQSQVAYSVALTILPATAITSAALHQGAPNVNSSAVVIGLCGTGPTPPCASLVSPGVLIADTFAVTPAQLNSMRAFGLYANVSTAGNPSGEIRGQVRNTAP